MRGLWLGAGLWLVAIALGGAVLRSHLINQHRQAQLDMAEFRLAALQGSLGATFNQMAAMPRAIARQSTVIGLLQRTQVAGSEHVSEADRPRLRQQLSAMPEVKAISSSLLETAHEFRVNKIYVLDRFGTTLADSSINMPSSVIGGNYRTRRYHSEAVEYGSASQFAVGRINAFPSFYFSARVGKPDNVLGVVVVRQETAALDLLLDDPHQRLMITDANGVVLMSNRAGDMLRHTPLQGPLTLSAQAQAELYRTQPRTRAWRIDSLDIGKQAVTQVQMEDGTRYFAQSAPLSYSDLTAWVLTPQEGEGTLMSTVAGGGALLLLSGWGALFSQAQRRKRLHAVTEGQQTLRHMAHALPLTVFRYETPPGEDIGRFTFIGQGLYKLLGLSPEDLHADPSLAWRLMGATDKQPPTNVREFPLILQGKHVWLRCESQCSLEADGTRIYNGYWADISARHHLSEQLQSVFTYSPLAFVYYDNALRVTRCNAAALALFGAQTESELVGLTPQHPPMSPPMDEATLTALRKALVSPIKRGEVARFEWRHTRLDGVAFDADVVAIPFVVDGQSFECAIIQDITARKAAETATREAQQAAEAAARTQAQFLANMSHEIRTPMNAIMGMIHLALMDNIGQKSRNYLDKAHLAANNLLQILNDVLDVSKIEAGKLEVECIDFQLDAVIGHMADMLGARAENKGLELLFTAAPDIPTALMGDPLRLGQVLINLGTNAIKFADHGEVLIGCEVQSQSDSHVVLHFWVRDNGIGMSDAQMSRLFQPFTQADSSTTRQYGGTGLGLAISRQLVTLMGGHIWVDSALGQGSTFHFTAHFGLQAQPASQRASQRALLASEMQGKRLLLVDDNAVAREVLGEMTRHMGLDVEVCDSGDKAIQRLKDATAAGQAHHILLVDWKMPGMDGIAFARHAIAMLPEHRPCVLLVTAFAREEALKAAEGVGLAGVLNKPITPSTLLDALGKALGMSANAQPKGATVPPTLAQAQQQLSGARVLLVEDQPLNQELACALLTRAGLSVVTAANGQECLEHLANTGPFDGVLMDCQMPVMDGYTATERIRANPAWASLPVIAMTASAMVTDRERVLRCGMNDHIAKPLDLERMFNTMARWITPSQPSPNDGAGPPSPHLAWHVPSLDTSDGLSRCMGNLGLYQRLLKGFARTQRHFAQQHDALADDPEAALALVHSLKGLAGNIGAHTLLQCAAELESAWASGNVSATTAPDHQAKLAALKADVHAALDAVLADIDGLNGSHSQALQPNSADAASLHDHWVQIGHLVAQQDAQAREQLSELLAVWPTLRQQPQVSALQHALDHYDFDAAHEPLRLLLQA